MTGLRDFFVGVGFATCAVVVVLLLLSHFVPEKGMLTCVNPVTGEVGLAARGQGNQVATSVTDLDGSVHYGRVAATAYTCESIYGKGWTDELD